jgi:hypothetical protein
MPPAHVDFECPDCGIPVYCSKEHWADDYEAHLQICDTLRQINEDDHDLRSGRLFPEFEYAGPQMEEALVNMTNWDTFLYTRNFNAINDDRSLRQVTRLLTYPVTIGSILHELSPYNLKAGGRLTAEGIKSFSGTCCSVDSKSFFPNKLIWLQRFATRCTHPRRAVAWIFGVCAWKHRQYASSFSEPGQSLPSLATPGYSLRTSSPERASTSSLSGLRA